ncbi:hypothetical protein [Mesorhizobium sp.]
MAAEHAGQATHNDCEDNHRRPEPLCRIGAEAKNRNRIPYRDDENRS